MPDVLSVGSKGFSEPRGIVQQKLGMLKIVVNKLRKLMQKRNIDVVC